MNSINEKNIVFIVLLVLLLLGTFTYVVLSSSNHDSVFTSIHSID